MGYLAYSSENNQTMHICALTSDYMDVESRYSRTFVGQAREAPAIFKYKDVFMMATSGCTGWDPNKLEVFWTRCVSYAALCMHLTHGLFVCLLLGMMLRVLPRVLSGVQLGVSLGVLLGVQGMPQFRCMQVNSTVFKQCAW